MLINLFSDPTIHSKLGQPLGYMRTRKCEVEGDLSQYERIVTDDREVQHHVNSVLSALGKAREYTSILGNLVDSHSEVEKLGVCRYQLKYSVIISMEDSLSYILHRLSGAAIENIEAIPGYKRISRSFMKLHFEMLDDDAFGLFSACDPKLEEYFTSLTSDVSGESEEVIQAKFTARFVEAMIGELKLVLEYVSFSYFFNRPKSSGNELKLRSKSLSAFIFTSNEKVEDTIVIKSTGFSDHTLIVRSFGYKEYSSNIGLEYAM